MPVDKPESTVQPSETRADTKAANLFDKRMRLLIASGLIAGITPTLIRKKSNQQILGFALLPQDGDDFPLEPNGTNS